MAESIPDLILVRRVDEVQGLIPITERTAYDDESGVDEPIHEGGMLLPSVLLPDEPRRVPVAGVHERQREVRHKCHHNQRDRRGGRPCASITADAVADWSGSS